MSEAVINIIPIPAFTDNYIWTLINESNGQCVCVDPGSAAEVIQFIDENQLTLSDILITHWHPDHSGGVQELIDRYQCKVYAPEQSGKLGFPFTAVDTLASIELDSLALEFNIEQIPGHTLDHVYYYSKPWLFCGDTLFNGGCGRVFEGSFEQMHHSLQKIAQLPEDTEIYCTHEYTLSNLAFALSVDPDNQKLKDYQRFCQQCRELDMPTLPCLLETQFAINPFLRCTESEDPVARFTELRQLKDTS